jgi:sporulation protein YlmC with PRC-barrel domain
MNVGQALLDQQVIDRSGQQMGKVDGVLIEFRKGQPPRVSSLVIGGGTAAHRLHPGFARWLVRWRRRWGPKHDGPYEVPWSKVLKIGVDVKVDLEAERTPALAWEHWIRRHIIGRIPGSGA